MNKLAKEITEWREQKGFYTPSSLYGTFQRDAMLGKLMLVVTEISEAAEEVRKDHYNGFKEEIADTFIRLLDIVGAMGIDIEQEIKDKMEKNKKRPTRHGKKTTL